MLPQHNYHLVDPSPWPFFSSWALFYLTLGAASVFHFFFHGLKLFHFAILFIIVILINWWRDVVREGTFTLHHTAKVQKSLRLGMVLFIVSEIMLFVAFFWAFFHSSLAPTVEIGCGWPPEDVIVFASLGSVLDNTTVLLFSGATITWAHHALLLKRNIRTSIALASTVGLGAVFLFLQYEEYNDAYFTINEGVYGSTFFLTTGLHGFMYL